jgi:hypothetical protein
LVVKHSAGLQPSTTVILMSALPIIHAVAPDGDALLSQHGGNVGLGDSETGSDPLRSFASLVQLRDIGDVIDGQEALQARFRGFRVRAQASAAPLARDRHIVDGAGEARVGSCRHSHLRPNQRR